MDQSNENKTTTIRCSKKNNDGTAMTTNSGMKVSEDEHSLTVGDRGPTLLEDFHFREKMMHFDHERILNVWYTHVDSVHMVNSKCMKI